MFKENDSKHEIITDVKLSAGGVLHRFVNGAGEPYSAIYDSDGVELFSCERDREKGMIDYWESMNNDNDD